MANSSFLKQYLMLISSAAATQHSLAMLGSAQCVLAGD